MSIGRNLYGMTGVGPASAVEAAELVLAGIMRLEDFGPDDQPSRAQVGWELAKLRTEEGA